MQASATHPAAGRSTGRIRNWLHCTFTHFRGTILDMDEDSISQLIDELLKTQKEETYERIKQDMFNELAGIRSYQSEYEERLYQRWKKALDLFETMLLFGRTVGSEFNERIRPYAVKHNDIVFEVLATTHAHSCMTTSAILALLKSGHAGDALARARTVHEMRVIVTFIQEQGDDLAERYLAYEVVESLKAARQYDKHYKRLGFEPLITGTLDNLEKAAENYHTKFLSHLPKKVLDGDYGWAAIVLKKDRPTFADIQAKVGLDHWRPSFKMATYPIHPSAKGIKFEMGRIGNNNILLAGPSNSGLADPASIALISFNAITTMLLTHMRYFDEKELVVHYLQSLIAAQVMGELLHEAQQAFLETHQQLVRDELDIQAQEEK
jgi:Family of unknown function (DUF5677)